ncbi:glycosyltransferase family 2 protein [Yinghuangia seranimata]|uniref:glycosyltransferase family 2 protein n=1 Tax=Yinghuangia seranimata TaxID=408067 RepID=UPI00248C82C1|nr:glycosyltransferase family 2 protein [Yinghuangia seranimata]MDI2125109.1 glycosyltransferase family 2 protein [Yinghuangia seranimata]
MDLKVTVVVPVHNIGAHFRACLDSVRAQTMPRSEYEVLFVDDGSSDRSARHLTEETALSANLRVLALPHSGGPGAPRNTGLDQARGEFVLFLDDDDRLAPEALATLYETAAATGADIVVPRTAGHGHEVASDAWDAPLVRPHVLTHPELETALTARQFFRRSFIAGHGLRFAEGAVPLAGEAFALAAHLLASGVAVARERVCYHRVRLDARDRHGAAPDPAAHAAGAEALFDVLDRHAAPGPAKDRLTARCYRVAVLDDLHRRASQGDAELRDAWVRASAWLATRRVPPAAEAHLPLTARVRSAVLRAERADVLPLLAEAEAGVTHQPHLLSAGWEGGRFAVRLGAHLVRQRKGRPTEPVRFVQDGDRVRWELPGALAGVPGVPEAADVTAELPGVRLDHVARHRDAGTEVRPAAEQRLAAEPLGRDAVGRPVFALRADATGYFDPSGAEHGAAAPAMDGLWDFFAELDGFGLRVRRRIGNNRATLADSGMRVAFTGAGVLADPYWTKYDCLTVWVNPPEPGALKKAVRQPEHTWFQSDGRLLHAGIPLELGPLAAPVPCVVTLSALDAEPVHCHAVVEAPAAEDLAVLRFAAELAQLTSPAGLWSLGVAVGSAPVTADLRLALRHDPGSGTWAVERGGP